MIKVVCGVIRNKNKFLIAQRKDCLLWEFPGGKVEKGESNNDALKREIKEELSIDIKPKIEITQFVYKNYILIFLLSEICSDNKIQLSQHLKFKWVEPSNFHKFKFSPGDLAVTQILSDSKAFF